MPKPLPFPIPSYGGAPYRKTVPVVIRLVLRGCVNRPFFHVAVQERIWETTDQIIEQIGSYDPLPNKYNEKLVAINTKRLEYWIREGATLTVPVLRLLGLSGYFPIHPHTVRETWLNRKRITQKIEELKISALSPDGDQEVKPSEPEAAKLPETETAPTS